MSGIDTGAHLLPSVKKYMILLALLWTVLICCLAGWHNHYLHKYSGVDVGVNVSVESELFYASERSGLVQHSIIFLIIWLTGICGIFFSSWSLSKHVFRRKKTEYALYASEMRHRELTYHLPQRIFHKDANLDYVFCNKRYADDLGILSEEIAGKSDFDLYPRELAEKYRADDRRLMTLGKSEEIEEIYLKDGEERLIRTVKTPLKDDAGNVTGILGIFWDITDRKRANEALRVSEERFSKAFHNSPDMIAITRMSDGLIIEINEAFEEMFQMSRESVIGKTNTEIGVFPEGASRDEYVSIISSEGSIRNFEFRSMRSSGEVFDTLISGETIEIDGEKCLLTLIRDITERKRGEQALKDAERRSLATLENSPVCTKIVDLDHNLQYMSRSGIELLKIEDITEYYGKSYPFDFFPESSKDVMIKNLEKVRKTGEVITQEVPVVDLEGNELWFHSTLVPVNDEAGQLDYFIVVSMETTARMQAEEALRVSEDRFSKAFHNSPDLILITRMSDGLIIEVNEVCQEMFQVTRESVIGKKVTETGVYPECVKREELVSEIHLDGKFKNLELQLMSPLGVMFDALLSGEMIEIDGEECILTVIRDITERKRAQEAILASEQRLMASNQQLKANEQEREGLLKDLKFKNRELRDIVYTASHDLKSPLVNISGFSGHLSVSCEDLERHVERIDDPSSVAKIKDLVTNEIPESLGFITSSVVKMKSLIDGLLRISRIGTAEINIVNVDMNVLLGKVSDAMGYQLQENVSRFHVGSLPACRGDVGLLNQVFTNLIDNAIKYRESSRDCEIEVSGEIVGGEAVYCVKDNGIGVEEAFQGKVFEIFHRLNPGEGIAGEGLGLTIVTRIVYRLGGRIWLESEAGAGSEFFVALPIK